MKAVIWGYEYDDMRESWYRQMGWLVNSLKKNNIEVKLKNMKCRGINLPEYDYKSDNPCDIVIYNHTDMSVLIGNVLKAKRTWFFKPTVPDEFHTTLDIMGYGPYSSITYDKPEFEGLDFGDFFDTKVKGWIDSRMTKWGNKKFSEETVETKDYWLVLGQCGGDSVVTKHDFGGYFTKLEQIIRELVRIDNRQVVVKLHPYTDGKDSENTCFSDHLKDSLSGICKPGKKDSQVIVYSGKSNIHNFIDNSRAVILANSGAGFEAMMHHKPIICWGFPEYHWVSYDLRHLADMRRAIKLDWFNREKQDRFLYWYMEKYCFYNQDTCDRRVYDLLNPGETFDDLWSKYRPSQGYSEYKMFMDFIKNKLPNNPVVVEIGVRRGNQRYFYKKLLNANYKGIDISNIGGDDFICGDSKSYVVFNKLKDWLNGRKIDLLFIDGDHSYEGVKRDYEMYSPLSNIIVMHDINTTNPNNVGVKKFWSEIKKQSSVEFKCHESHGYSADGIGVILEG